MYQNGKYIKPSFSYNYPATWSTIKNKTNITINKKASVNKQTKKPSFFSKKLLKVNSRYGIVKQSSIDSI